MHTSEVGRPGETWKANAESGRRREFPSCYKLSPRKEGRSEGGHSRLITRPFKPPSKRDLTQTQTDKCSVFIDKFFPFSDHRHKKLKGLRSDSSSSSSSSSSSGHSGHIWSSNNGEGGHVKSYPVASEICMQQKSAFGFSRKGGKR